MIPDFKGFYLNNFFACMSIAFVTKSFLATLIPLMTLFKC